MPADTLGHVGVTLVPVGDSMFGSRRVDAVREMVCSDSLEEGGDCDNSRSKDGYDSRALGREYCSQ